MIRYRVIRRDGSLGPPISFAKAYASARLRVLPGQGPFRIRLEGKEAGPPRDRRGTLQRASSLMKAEVLGMGFRIRNGKGKIVWGVKVVSIEPPVPVPDLGTHPDLEKIHGYVWNKFKGIHSAGRYYCRYVDGTYIVSRHGYKGSDWYGSAEDIGAGTMDQLWDIARFIVAETQAGRLNARTVIVANMIWTAGIGWRRYYGNYHYHVHVDVEGGWPCNP